MTIALLAGGEPHTQRDLKERWKERGLDVRHMWPANAKKWPDLIPPTVEVVIQLRDACKHACSNNLDRTIRRMRQRPEGSVTYIVTRRRAPYWAAALDAYGYPVRPRAQATVPLSTREIEEAQTAREVEAALLSSDACDECNGSGKYFIDGEPQACICSEPQTDSQTTIQESNKMATTRAGIKHKSPRTPFTQAETQEVLELLKSGETVTALAAAYNCSTWPVAQVAKKYKLNLRQIKKQVRSRRAAAILSEGAARSLNAAAHQAATASSAEVKATLAAARVTIGEALALAGQSPSGLVPENQTPMTTTRAPRNRRKPMATCTQADLDRAKWLVDGVAMGMIEVV